MPDSIKMFRTGQTSHSQAPYKIKKIYCTVDLLSNASFDMLFHMIENPKVV
jgi:hypothetical protein